MKLTLEGNEVCDYLKYLSSRREIVIRPQTSGPCVHYGADGCEYRGEGPCPHLYYDSVDCPIIDIMLAQMRRGGPEDAVPTTPRVPENGDPWTEEDEIPLHKAGDPRMAIALYRLKYPETTRTDRAIESAWYRMQQRIREREGSLPDFPGDTYPITQSVDKPRYSVDDRVRVSLPASAAHGETGRVVRYYPATEQYLIRLDDLPEIVWVRGGALEAV